MEVFHPLCQDEQQSVKQAQDSIGIIRYGTAADFRAKMFYTCSVWQDRRAMNGFVRGEPHLTAMNRIGIWGGPKTAFADWDAEDDPTDWEEVRWRLEEALSRAQPR